MTVETFKPIGHTAPIGIFGKAKFLLRLILDLQVNSVFSLLYRERKNISGNLLDVGCGESPYAFLFEHAKYHGLDIEQRDRFQYQKDNVKLFDGKKIPFADEFFDSIICTEVLEHSEEAGQLVREMHRVLKKSGVCYVTVPWSARFHYIPWDYYRYTPTTLQNIFCDFKSVQIKNRGTDLTSVAAKIILIFSRNLIPQMKFRYFLFLPFWMILSPTLLFWVFVGQITLLKNIGSPEDPLGYSVIARKGQ